MRYHRMKIEIQMDFHSKNHLYTSLKYIFEWKPNQISILNNIEYCNIECTRN